MALKWSKLSYFDERNQRAVGYLERADDVFMHPESFDDVDRQKAANILRSHGHLSLAESIERTKTSNPRRAQEI